MSIDSVTSMSVGSAGAGRIQATGLLRDADAALSFERDPHTQTLNAGAIAEWSPSVPMLSGTCWMRAKAWQAYSSMASLWSRVPSGTLQSGILSRYTV
jgi:hypothetical protein